MADVPGQLNFYDLALVICPPGLLVLSLVPAAAACGIIDATNLEASKKFVSDWGWTVGFGAVVLGFAGLFTTGQLLLGIADDLRRPIQKLHNRKKDPFRLVYDRFKSKAQFDACLTKYFPDLSGASARTKVWTAAGCLQQVGNYGNADRFNALAIFCFCTSFVLGLATLVSLCFCFSWLLAGWAAICAVLVWVFWRRSNLFYQFFSTVVITNVIWRLAIQADGSVGAGT